MPAIEVRGLFKTYGEISAVDGVDLTVESGEVFACSVPTGRGRPPPNRKEESNLVHP
jgi:ABC-2 type transport system ATP-binding protein